MGVSRVLGLASSLRKMKISPRPKPRSVQETMVIISWALSIGWNGLESEKDENLAQTKASERSRDKR